MAFESPDFEPRALFAEMTPETFALWQHSPITAAFLRFIEDQIQVWREGAADLVELGHFKDNADHEDQDIRVVRGKIASLRQLRGIGLSDIQRFYGVDRHDDETQETGTDDEGSQGG